MRNGLRKILVPSWAALLLVARTAGAQGQAGLGMHESGGFILSAERLFGLSFWSVNTQQDAVPGVPGATGTDTTTSGTTASLLFGQDFSGLGSGGLPYTTPRVAFDFLPIESLTIGGSIGFVSTSGERESINAPTRDINSITAFAFAPRVGYILPLADWVYFWPRLGVTYYSLKVTDPATPTSPESSVSFNGFAINVEPAFVFSPVPHFGISVIPVADIPLAGSTSQEPPDPTPEPDTSVRIRNFGATVGLVGFF
jgi:hypothetical protein